MTWSPLTTHWQVNTEDRRSRRGRKITGIGHHHTASTSLAGSLSQFLPGGRTVTPNYCIWRDRIIGIVDEDYRALTTADPIADESSITYEIVNETGPNAWAFHEQTLQTVARLDADVVRRYGVPLQEGLPGFWQHRNIYEWFRRGYATACAGPSWSTADIIARVRAELEDPEEDFLQHLNKDEQIQLRDNIAWIVSQLHGIIDNEDKRGPFTLARAIHFIREAAYVQDGASDPAVTFPDGTPVVRRLAAFLQNPPIPTIDAKALAAELKRQGVLAVDVKIDDVTLQRIGAAARKAIVAS